MRWKSVKIKPATDRETRVLLAKFNGDHLATISVGFWYPDESGGFFAPARHDSGYTHWMTYDSYWKFMERLEKL